MIEKKDKAKTEQKPRDDGIELENQFILRIPEEAATLLHEILITPNGNLKDRMTIKLDADLRYGEVRLDHWLLYGKMVDLPTIIECQKTIDSKSFYKSADICQMLICKTEPHDLDKEESPNKGKKKDNTKVDKKFLWAHGITPPCKNIRKRRFRKTLKKKNVEAPEIEKEVKRLLRIDNDAVKVDFEIINEEVDKQYSDGSQSKDNTVEAGDDSRDVSLTEDSKHLADVSSRRGGDHQASSDLDEDDGAMHLPMSSTIENVGEHDIFGEEVSSSSDDDNTANSRLNDLDDNSRLSADDTRMTTFSAAGGAETNQSRSILDDNNTTKHDDQHVNEFPKKLFSNTKSFYKDENSFQSQKDGFLGRDLSGNSQSMPANFTDEQGQNRAGNNNNSNNDNNSISEDDVSNEVGGSGSQLTQLQIEQKILNLRTRLREAKAQYAQKSQEISSIQNATLRHRMQETLDNLASEIVEQELEIKDLESIAES